MMPDTSVKALLNMMVKHTTAVQKQEVTKHHGVTMYVDQMVFGVDGTTAQIAVKVSGYILTIY